ERAVEYLDIVTRALAGDGPFDYSGSYYRVEGAPSLRHHTGGRLPELLAGGSSPGAIDLAARHAASYASWIEPLAELDDLLTRARSAAVAGGRSLGGATILGRIVIADTDEEA